MKRGWIAVHLMLLVSSGCAAGGSEGGDARTYRVRGVVVRLPSAGDASLTLRHEAMPDFVDRSDARVGMDGMTMPFPIAPDVELAGVAAGDAVEFTLTVDWDADQPVEVTAVRELPPGTTIHP